ncbi:hypothetical protein FB446DRAFT_844072 [Lentinula raphanica]|nr:hypothetical protein FB446DRAFT_844072 [Lentinula raphanica]
MFVYLLSRHSLAFPVTAICPSFMATSITRTISMALYLLLLASALKPGLKAAPLSVAVQTLPIEQDIERRAPPIQVLARRVVFKSGMNDPVNTKMLDPEEYIQILVGKKQILDLQAVPQSKNKLSITPVNYQKRGSERTIATFLLGHLHLSDLMKRRLLGSPSNERGIIHDELVVEYEISQPKPNFIDLILGADAIVHRIASFPQSYPQERIRFVEELDYDGQLTTMQSYLQARLNWVHYTGSRWDTSLVQKIKEGSEAWGMLTAWVWVNNLAPGDYYRRLSDNIEEELKR